ncbi:MAG TPA: NADP-dependent malic enzyme [Caldilineaceae bacterium]|nr:NADP-dependent malic enzyme [Caldilineaceae bacterium]
MSITKQAALEYHASGRPGKLKVVATKPMDTQYDLSLAYSPGVAHPVLEIAQQPDLAYDYTAKGNLVAVISNGSAILGLGNRGAQASKPVMEGKAVLFKRFADVDVFDIEVNTADPEEMVRFIELISPTFGGINLEDIKAPECFYIEQEAQRRCDIPVFHDDQHGTAIISGAGLLNALELVQKSIDDIRIVINGAGAAGIAVADLYVALGARPEHIIMADSTGVIYKGREKGMNEYKARYAAETSARTLSEALVDADVFIGLSAANILSQKMVRSMARDPIIFAMANPDPEITYEEVQAARHDVIFGTGRSDYPNQVNNVLGFPFIFRGALDVRARAINMEMKLAATRALADLAKEDVPDSVMRAYGLASLRFGRDYIIPKPLDPRVLMRLAPAVARAAMESGVARRQIDLDAYMDQLAGRMGHSTLVMRKMERKAQQQPKRLVFGEGEHPKIIRAAYAVETQGIATPILLGRAAAIAAHCRDLGLDYRPEVIDPNTSANAEAYARLLYERRQRKGVTLASAHDLIRQPNYFGPMMVEHGDADGFIAGLTYNYPDVLRPALQVVGPLQRRWVSGVYLMLVQDRLYFFTDATVIIEPTVEQLAAIAINAANLAREFDVEPKIAMLSFSNFGSTPHEQAIKMRQATELVKKQHPELQIDGEMQADVAVVPELMERHYPFSQVRDANVLVFPHLAAANTAYKLLSRLGGAEAIGPILVGMGKPIQVLATGADVRDIVNVAILTAVDAQYRTQLAPAI